MAKLYKRGRFWWVDFTTADGHRHRMSTRATTERAAQTRARALVSETEQAEAERRAGIQRREPLRVDRALNQWLDAVEGAGSGYAASYRRSLRRTTDRVLRPRWGRLDVAEVTRPAILAWRDELAAHARSASTVNRMVAALRTFLSWLVSRGLLTANPAHRLDMLKERPMERHRALTAQELQCWFVELLRGAPGNARHDPERAVEHCRWLRFLCETGLRQGEAQALRRHMVDVDRRAIHLPATLCKGAAARTVPLTLRAIETLRGQGIDGMPADGLIWGTTSRRGALAGAWARAELPGRVPTDHDCRHTAASLWIDAGATVLEVKAILGHRSILTTERYMHRYSRRSADLAARLDAGRHARHGETQSHGTVCATIDPTGRSSR